MIKNVTKKEVRELLKKARSEHPFGWRVWSVGAYIYNDNVNLYINYQGQGMDQILYEGSYSDKVNFTDLIDKQECTLKVATDQAYDSLMNMVERYSERKEAEAM